MKNGPYSIHVKMLDGHPDRGAGILVLRDGTCAAQRLGKVSLTFRVTLRPLADA